MFLEYTLKNSKHLGGAKKVVTAVIVSTLLLSFSPVSVFASCSPEEQYQIETEIRMMESIITAPSPAERRQNSLDRINAIAQTHTTAEKEVQGLLLKHYPQTLPFETIRHIDFETEIVDPNNITNGRGELHTATLYEDETTGYSVDGFDFAIEDGKVIHFELDPLIPEQAIQAALEEAKDFVPTEPEEVKQDELQEPQQLKPLPPIEEELTPQEIHEGAKMSAQVTKDELEARRDSNCQLIVSATSGGEYDWVKAVEYAYSHWGSNMYNPNYPDYRNRGGDCTNFASQVVQAGGLVQDSGYNQNFLGIDDESDTRNWYVRKNWLGQFENRKSWSSVIHFLDHMNYHENTSDLLDIQARGYEIFNEMNLGDLIFADLGKGGKNHVMIVTSWDYVGNKRVPRLTYHTDDHRDKSFNVILKENEDANARYWGMKILSPIR